jgi:hypothetical protein
MADERNYYKDFVHHALLINMEIQEISMRLNHESCINDRGHLSTYSRNRKVTCHKMPTSQDDVKDVLVELAFILQNTKDIIESHTTFPLRMCSLVANVDGSGEVDYFFNPDHNIHMCKPCVQDIWKKINSFKTSNPEIVLERLEPPDIKEPCDF